ncbi:sirohydrochlorin chelatase [Candidatus Endowatersipora endosymbiont of Watersipora subatra]|uniref:sirohydrochlorin chelatase n=1 Tax=Candidatus Endowatersipora endosymbiont of Watersipora subatra TaxID=3077946 RepID=UPI00312C71CC
MSKTQSDTKKTGVIICGHGSRNQNAMKEFTRIIKILKGRFDHMPVEYGYLEFAHPLIHQGLDQLREQGCINIVAVPGMLFAAGHTKNDIPSVLNTYQINHPDVTIKYGRELGLDLKMIRAAGERIEETLVSSNNRINRYETLLMVVGRGTSDPDANSNVSKMMRMLWEGMGFGWGEVCYSGVTFPLVEPALEKAVKLGYKRIIIFPYFLFTGVLVKRIFSYTDMVAEINPHIEFLKANYLSDHPLIIDTFVDRVNEVEYGYNVMNCQMCKYREPVLGFEDDVGLVQKSYHCHVEGMGRSLHNCPCKGDCDASCHEKKFCQQNDLPWTPSHKHNHIYRYADHPLGPHSMKNDA